jgi:hypothetical protein
LKVKSGVSARCFWIETGSSSTVTNIVLPTRALFMKSLTFSGNVFSLPVPMGSPSKTFTIGKKSHVSLDTVHSRVTGVPSCVPVRKDTSRPSKEKDPSHCVPSV